MQTVSQHFHQPQLHSNPVVQQQQ
jgi:tetratricopeptide (TPR) repeat protein